MSDSNSEDKRASETAPSSSRDVYEASYDGAQDRPFIPRLRSDPAPYHPIPRTLAEFRNQEGRAERKRRLQALWKLLPQSRHSSAPGDVKDSTRSTTSLKEENLTAERAAKLKDIYDQELIGRCSPREGSSQSSEHPIPWPEFRDYALAKEAGERYWFETPCSLKPTFILRTMDPFPRRIRP